MSHLHATIRQGLAGLAVAAVAASGAAAAQAVPVAHTGRAHQGSVAPTAPLRKPVPRGDVTYRVDVDGDDRADTVTLRRIDSSRGRDRYRLAVKTAGARSASLTVSTDAMGEPASSYWYGATGIDGIRGNEIVLDLVGGIGDATDIRSYAWRNGRIALVAAPGRPASRPDWEVMWAGYGAARGWTFSQKGTAREVIRHDLKASRSGRFYGTNTRYRWSGKGWKKISTAKVSGIERSKADTIGDLRGLVWR